jgi:hypothetical protein
MLPGTYGPSSCSVNVSQPLSLTGAGSVTTVVDCGTDRVLLSNDSLVLTGLTLRNGLVVGTEPVTPNGTVFGATWGAGGC